MEWMAWKHKINALFFVSRESIKQIIALLLGIAVMGLVTFVNHNPAMH